MQTRNVGSAKLTNHGDLRMTKTEASAIRRILRARRQFLKLAALLGDLVQTYRSGAAGVASGPQTLPDQ